MIVGEIKNKIDRIWEMFWTGGLTNPLSVIEQLTYLIFIKRLDETDSLRERECGVLEIDYKPIFPKDQPELRWSNFKSYDAARMFETVQGKVFPFIKNIHNGRETAYSTYMEDALFLVPTPQLLQRIVTALDDIPMHDRDTQGDIYEYMLGKLNTSGQNGQFRTPRHIIRMMVDLTAPMPDDFICDPAMGTAGFLVAAGEYLRENQKEMFYKPHYTEHYNNRMFTGFDMDRTMLRIGAMNMMLHGVENPKIEYRDSLSEQNPDTGKYSLVLANPPFKGSLDYDSVSADLLKTTRTKKTELLFLALFLRLLKPGGRCACIVPDGVLFGSSTAHRTLREHLVEKHQLRAVISMPSGVFKPYAGVSTAVLVFTKTGAGGTDNVWFYDMQSDGFSLDDKRTPLDASDIPDIVQRFHSLAAEADRPRTAQSFLVPKAEIAANNYDLSLNKYKEVVHKAVQYDPPAVILDRIEKMECEIMQGIEELRGMVGHE